MLSESRKKKLAMLTKSIASGDIAKASELLRTHGHSGVNRHGKKENDPAAGGAPGSGLVLLVDACPGVETVLTEIVWSRGMGVSPMRSTGILPVSERVAGILPASECGMGVPPMRSTGVPPVSESEQQQQHNSKKRQDASKMLATQQDTGGTPVEHMGKMPMPQKFWTIRKTLAQVDPENLGIASQYAAVLRGARQRLDELEASPGLCHVANARPEDLLFMDIESCGLYGASVFLVGMMSFREGELHFEQCLARTYAEEAAILTAFSRRLEETGVLVTFNGRAFDMNMIRDRCAFHRMTLEDARVPHLDLLYESRRRWKGKLPNCKLQTLETHLCGRRRYGDIPGWAIPDAYHRFVDTGDARQVRDILHHNLLDLLTMAQLLTVILTGEDPAISDFGLNERRSSE